VRWLCQCLAAVRFSYGDPPWPGQGRVAAARSLLSKRQVRDLRDGSQRCGDGELAEARVSVGKIERWRSPGTSFCSGGCSSGVAQSLSVNSISKTKLEPDSIICFVEIWHEGGKDPGLLAN
jgi:hypothetical protein